MKILNLDKIKVEDKIVLLGKKEYIIPGELPISVMFELLDNSQKLESNPNDKQLNEKAVKQLYNIFCIKNEMKEFEKFKQMISLSMFSQLMAFIFDSENEEKKSKKN